MITTIPSKRLIQQIASSETNYMYDRMTAIQMGPDNPEGIEINRFGNAFCFYSRTMHWPAFNTVKGITSADVEWIDPLIDFYRKRERKAQFEIVPSLVDEHLLKCLSDRGFYQSGFHVSMYMEPTAFEDDRHEHLTVQKLRKDQFEIYATIHCRGTGLPDHGIPYVAANNSVLYDRPGWKFYIASVDGQPAAVGVTYMKAGIASLTFAATLPEFRNRGLHQRLLKRRIEEARRNDCRLVVSQCSFLSQSHRNMERIGMKIGYVRTTWTQKSFV